MWLQSDHWYYTNAVDILFIKPEISLNIDHITLPKSYQIYNELLFQGWIIDLWIISF